MASDVIILHSVNAEMLNLQFGSWLPKHKIWSHQYLHMQYVITSAMYYIASPSARLRFNQYFAIYSFNQNHHVFGPTIYLW